MLRQWGIVVGEFAVRSRVTLRLDEHGLRAGSVSLSQSVSVTPPTFREDDYQLLIL